MTTSFLDLDTCEHVFVPNSLISENQVSCSEHELSRPELESDRSRSRWRPMRTPRAVERTAGWEASRRNPADTAQGNRAPVVRVLQRSRTAAMMLTIFIWIDDVANRHLARTEYRRNLVQVFRENGMEFAIPRSQVWIDREGNA